MARRPQSFYEVLTEAVNDMDEHGYDSQDRVEGWLTALRAAAERSMTSPRVLERELNALMKSIYQKQIERGMIVRLNPGLTRFTLARVKPRLRAELDRRIMASAALIKLNRRAAIEKTLQRFSGWSTSIPPGGTEATDKRETKTEIRKALASLPFEERRVLIDQGHKFTSNLSEIIAVDGQAIAGIWHSHWEQTNYNYRKTHKERDERFYVVRGNWAMERGLMKVGKDGYTDDITKPGEEVFCRCFYEWVYNLRSLPDELLTVKGREAIEEARQKVKDLIHANA